MTGLGEERNKHSTSFLTFREALVWASSLLHRIGLNPKVAEWVLMSITGLERTRFLSRLDQPLSNSNRQHFHTLIERILTGEPYQYVLGEAEFFGRLFHVDPSVLIPRPETELLVEAVLQHLEEKCLPPVVDNAPLTIVDVGTGSGAIAITLDLELKEHLHAFHSRWEGAGQSDTASLSQPAFQIYALDIEEDALEVARSNAVRLGAEVTFLHSDLLEQFISKKERIDVIVSNPPYIAERERSLVDHRVLSHEPHTALFAGEDGLLYYRKIVAQSSALLNCPGLIAFEVGAEQAREVEAIIRQTYPQATCQITPDLQGLERVVVAKIDGNCR